MPSSAVSSIQCLDGSKIIISACLEARFSYLKFQVFNFFQVVLLEGCAQISNHQGSLNRVQGSRVCLA